VAAVCAALQAQTLPGSGLAQHPFLYCGEWQNRSTSEQTMYIVRDGKIVWSYTNPSKGRTRRRHDAAEREHCVFAPVRGEITPVQISVAGWMNQRYLQMIEYLREENHVLCEQLGKRRWRLSDESTASIGRKSEKE
jgi:hypothetical protein